MIHELTGPVIPTVLPGVVGVHAVDAAGVHPLLLAIGSERYWPFAETQRPQELLTQANAILGQGQLSLAKFLLIANQADDPQLDLHDIAAFLRHILERADWTRDLHFQTETTIDTLDYSGGGLNAGSKARHRRRRPASDSNWRPNSQPTCACPMASAIRESCCRASSQSKARSARRRNSDSFDPRSAIRNPQFALPPTSSVSAHAFTSRTTPIARFRWIVIVDDSQFVAESLRNFLWVTFTRTNPAADIHGIEPFVHDKHWGCRGPLVIDARLKPHHAPPLVEDPEVIAPRRRARRPRRPAARDHLTIDLANVVQLS